MLITKNSWKLMTFLLIILISCDSENNDLKDKYYAVINNVIIDQGEFSNTLIVIKDPEKGNNSDSIYFRDFDLYMYPSGIFNLDSSNNEKKIRIGNQFIYLNKSSFPTMANFNSYNFHSDSTQIPFWDSIKIKNCYVVAPNFTLKVNPYLDISFPLEYRHQKDMLLLSYPLFNELNDSALIVSEIITKNYMIQSLLNLVLIDSTWSIYDRSSTLLKIVEDSMRDENSNLIKSISGVYKGSF